MSWAACISSDMCSLREHLALVNKTACKNILSYFLIVIALGDFFLVVPLFVFLSRLTSIRVTK